MRRKSMMNSGFSLVELVVVILIIGIISVSGGMAISVVYNASAKRAAKNMTAAMTEARQQAMSGDDDDFFFTRLYSDSDNNYYVDVCRSRTTADGGESTYTVLSTKKLGNDKIDIFVGTENSVEVSRKSVGSRSTSTLKEVRHVFDKDNGKLAETITFGPAGGVGAHQTASNSKYVDINVTGSTTFQVIVVEVTGRAYIYGE